MKIDYLTWVKNNDSELHKSADCYNLLHSGVFQPTKIFFNHIEKFYFSNNFMNQFEQPNSWGHINLLQNIAKEYENISTDRILLTNGASSAIFLVCQSLSGEMFFSPFIIHHS
jgi:aspartate/methionine/tyrosine aminotransferase